MRTAIIRLARLFNFLPNSTNTKPIAYINANNVSNSNNASSCYKTDSANNRTGLVLGVWSGEDVLNGLKMTDVGREINSQTKGLLINILKTAYIGKQGDIKVLRELHPEFNYIAVVKLDGQCMNNNVEEDIGKRKEAVRIASAIGCRKLRYLGMKKIEVEDFDGLADSAAEGSILGMYLPQYFECLDQRLSIPGLPPYHIRPNLKQRWTGLVRPGHRLSISGLQPYDIPSNLKQWRIGLVKASSQNYARQLMDMPGHLLNPTTFAENIDDVLSRSGVSVELKGKDWAEKHGMSGFLGVAWGSCEPPLFLELSYHGGENKGENPVILVGSGVTLYKGGVYPERSRSELIAMRGDIGGAACVAAVTRAVAELKLPINLRTFIPLVENLPGYNFMKPGEKLILMDGSVVQLCSSDVGGQIVLADALYYSNQFKPRVVLSVGSSSPWLVETIHTQTAVAFTPLDSLWTRVQEAAYHSGERVVRLPLQNIHRERMFNDEGDHIIGKDDTMCSTPLFLKEFIHSPNWIHFETDNVMFSCEEDILYLKDGMTGRPTRTLIELIAQLSSINCK